MFTCAKGRSFQKNDIPRTAKDLKLTLIDVAEVIVERELKLVCGVLAVELEGCVAGVDDR